MSTADDPLQQSIERLPGVTPPRLEQLRRLGLQTVRDLLFHFPRSYEDLTDFRPIAKLTAGALQTVQGEVVEIDGRRLADGRAVVSIAISDDNRTCLEGVWFNQVYMASKFRYGQRLSFSGKPKWFRDHWQMPNPRVQTLDGPLEAGDLGIVPVYPLTEELRADQLRPILRRTVEGFAGLVVEILPEELRRRRTLPDVRQALYSSSIRPTRSGQRGHEPGRVGGPSPPLRPQLCWRGRRRVLRHHRSA